MNYNKVIPLIPKFIEETELAHRRVGSSKTGTQKVVAITEAIISFAGSAVAKNNPQLAGLIGIVEALITVYNKLWGHNWIDHPDYRRAKL